jgi:hypothetical protein
LSDSLTLSDAFLLLRLGKRNLSRTSQELYTVGIVFIELLFRGHLELDEKAKVRVRKEEETGIQYLDELLDFLKKEKPRKLKRWMDYFSNRKKRRRAVHEAVLTRLQANKMVHTREEKILGILSKHRLVAEEKAKEIVIRRIRAEVLESGNVTDQTFVLCMLSLKAKLFRLYFSKREEGEIKARLKEWQNKNPEQWEWVKSVQRAIDEMDTAFVAAFTIP